MKASPILVKALIPAILLLVVIMAGASPVWAQGTCFCKWSPDGHFLLVTLDNCSVGYIANCDTSNTSTLCRCVKRTCGDCPNGCSSAGVCSGKEPGDDCGSGNKCRAIENCENEYVCCGCSP